MREKNPPSFSFPLVDQILVEDGDERNGKEARSRHMIQYFRQHKRHLVGVYRRPSSAHIGNNHFAKQSDDPAQKDRGHHDEGCDADLFIKGSRRGGVFFRYGFFCCGHVSARFPGKVNGRPSSRGMIVVFPRAF